MKTSFIDADPFSPSNPSFPGAEDIGTAAVLGVRRAQEIAERSYGNPNSHSEANSPDALGKPDLDLSQPTHNQVV